MSARQLLGALAATVALMGCGGSAAPTPEERAEVDELHEYLDVAFCNLATPERMEWIADKSAGYRHYLDELREEDGCE